MFESVIISHEMERGLKEDVCRAMMAQVHRYDHKLGRFDNSGHETYARVKQCLDGVSDAIKPMDKTLSHVWEQVCSADETVLAAFLREMLTEAEHACVRILCLGAMITRGLNTLAGEDGEPLGQATMEELPEVDDGYSSCTDCISRLCGCQKMPEDYPRSVIVGCPDHIAASEAAREIKVDLTTGEIDEGCDWVKEEQEEE